jgi:hypothetical protein
VAGPQGGDVHHEAAFGTMTQAAARDGRAHRTWIPARLVEFGFLKDGLPLGIVDPRTSTRIAGPLTCGLRRTPDGGCRRGAKML